MDEARQQGNVQGTADQATANQVTATPGTAAEVSQPVEQVAVEQAVVEQVESEPMSAEANLPKNDEWLNGTFDTNNEPMSAEANLPNEAEVTPDLGADRGPGFGSVGQEAPSEGFAAPDLEPFDLSPESPVAADTQPQTAAPGPETQAQTEELNQRIEALKAQLEERNNQYMRLAADFENYRKRTQKEKEDQEQQVKGATVKELLSVVDNFERARSQIKPQSDAEKAINTSYQGIYKDFVDRLKKIGVTPMRAKDEPFDPSLHEAVMREETDQYPEGTVVEELRRGYVLGDIVLRHAMVKVATAPEYSTSAEEEAQG